MSKLPPLPPELPPPPPLWSADALDAEIEAHLRLALATWPQIDAEVEAIVTRIVKAQRVIDREALASLARVGLTKEEFKVLLNLQHSGSQSHGALCRRLGVSTGAMTNRLDKLERAGLISRLPDPHDRRGVFLEITPAGRAKLDDCVNRGAKRERELLARLTVSERKQLSRLLQKLTASLDARQES